MGLFANLVVVTIGVLTTVLMGFLMIPFLKKLKFGQTILDIGPRWHKDKQGTPTMGGFMFIIGTLVAVVVGYLLNRVNINKDLTTFTTQNKVILLLSVIMALGYAFIGFVDDYLKVVRKQNEGLNERQKLVLQFIVAIGYIVALYIAGQKSTIVWFPFIGQVDFGIFYYPLVVIGIVYMVNVVNLTDGVDGLCSSVTLMVALGFIVISHLLGYSMMELLAAALAGGCIGFLFWNAYPAKVFMGDTGSLFLGGVVVALAFGLGIPVILIFMGIVYIVEGLTVMIQTMYFKYTRKKTGEGKRLFKMTPIHHHFEMLGWKENKIVIVFSLIQLIACAIGVLAVVRI